MAVEIWETLPTRVEAVQWDGTEEGFKAIKQFISSANTRQSCHIRDLDHQQPSAFVDAIRMLPTDYVMKKELDGVAYFFVCSLRQMTSDKKRIDDDQKDK